MITKKDRFYYKIFIKLFKKVLTLNQVNVYNYLYKEIFLYGIQIKFYNKGGNKMKKTAIILSTLMVMVCSNGVIYAEAGDGKPLEMDRIEVKAQEKTERFKITTEKNRKWAEQQLIFMHKREAKKDNQTFFDNKFLSILILIQVKEKQSLILMAVFWFVIFLHIQKNFLLIFLSHE